MDEMNDMEFRRCVFCGVKEQIDFDIRHEIHGKYGTNKYLVDRYNEEYIVSGVYLTEKLEEYKEMEIRTGYMSAESIA